jgi:hypothetical protein
MKLFFFCLPLGFAAALASLFLYVNPPNCILPDPNLCSNFGEQRGGFPLPVLRDNVGSSPPDSWGKIDSGDIASANLPAFSLNLLFYSGLFWAAGQVSKRLRNR